MRAVGTQANAVFARSLRGKGKAALSGNRLLDHDFFTSSDLSNNTNSLSICVLAAVDVVLGVSSNDSALTDVRRVHLNNHHGVLGEVLKEAFCLALTKVEEESVCLLQAKDGHKESHEKEGRAHDSAVPRKTSHHVALSYSYYHAAYAHLNQG